MRYLFSFVLASFLFSCGTGLPTEDMALKKIIDRQSPQDKLVIELADFKKTNGVKSDVFGQEIYEMDYHVKFIAKQDFHEYSQAYQNHTCPDTSKIYVDRDKPVAKSPFNLPTYPPRFLTGYKKGDLIKEYDGKVKFVKKENGWE